MRYKYNLKSNIRQQILGVMYIELIVSLALLSIVAMTVVPMTYQFQQRQKETQLRQSLMQIREAIDAYKRASDQGRIKLALGDSGYPKSLDELRRGVEDLRSSTRQKIYFLRILPIDPMQAQNVGDGLQNTNWGLRSYLSDPDNPKEGIDIFDVYSLSPQIGLNGVAYRHW